MNTSFIQSDRASRTGPLNTRSQERPRPYTPNLSAWGLALVELVIGYEWLISALNKVFSSTFRTGLADAIRTSSQDNPNGWWVTLMQRLVIPYAPIWATLVEVAEILVALGLFAGAALWISGRFPTARLACRLNVGVMVALVGGIAMTINYYLMAGHTLPGLHPGAPFDEGLSLDGVLTFIGVGLLAIHVLAHRVQAWSGYAERG